MSDVMAIVISAVIGTIAAIFGTLMLAKARCPVCNSSGSTSRTSDSGYTMSIEECSNCNGTGSVSLLNWTWFKLSKKTPFIR